ncbi:hypothetical protein CPB86DRAFT_57977 [Serendipita vermifera]|nr:hypothetical protein CPB86DRAFT_57977 [Serendipita vermifera]
MAASANFSELSIPHPSSLPSAEETHFSKSVISQLDHEIQVVQSKLMMLRIQLRTLQQKRANHASYIAPLRRVPTEVLREIVEICWEEGVNISILLKVSSRFRQTVIGLSVVWRKIRLAKIRSWTRHTIEEGLECASMSQVDEILRRAGKHLLDLTVDWPVPQGTLELISSRKSRLKP